MLAAQGFSHRLLALLQYLRIAGHDDAGGQVLCLCFQSQRETRLRVELERRSPYVSSEDSIDYRTVRSREGKILPPCFIPAGILVTLIKSSSSAAGDIIVMGAIALVSQYRSF